MRRRLDDWLRWQAEQHPSAIELGLERVAAVWSALAPGRFECPIITVAGTNGKGSCCAMIEAVYLAAGLRTACYTSPHVLKYNERIRLDGESIGDDALCLSYEALAAVCDAAPLTYFELGTLAAFHAMMAHRPDVLVLEVGMGGRLDAVNLLDADVALITTIGLDHTAWLGDTLDAIAAEKAGIMRPGKPVVIGHRNPVGVLLERADALGCATAVLGRDFDWQPGVGEWTLTRTDAPAIRLPDPTLRGRFQYDNAASVITAIEKLPSRLPVARGAIRTGIQRAHPPGRFQVIPSAITWILDVAHNAQAAAALAENLGAFNCPGRLHAVLGMAKDKEPAAVAGALIDRVSTWHLAAANDARAMPVETLLSALGVLTALGPCTGYPDLQAALAGASNAAHAGDCIIVFGSFLTVEAAMRYVGY